MTKINFLVRETVSLIWAEGHPVWKFQTPGITRPARYSRVMKNAVRAYVEMLGANVSGHIVVVTNDNAARLDRSKRVVSMEQMESEYIKVKDMIVSHIHTPFFSRTEMRWGEDTTFVGENHIYVDASTCTTGEDVIGCFTTHSQDGTETFEIETFSSVDAEYQGIQKAIHIGRRMARQTGKSVTVFADCMPAIIKAVILREEDETPCLGESVFIQWTPGHRHIAGMKVVDKASRIRMREMLARD